MEFELHGVKFKYEDGNIYRLWKYKKGDEWKQIKTQILKGYIRFQIQVNNKRNCIALHRLIYWLHNPDWDIYNSSTNNSIDHIDGNPLNNNIGNLRVVTHRQNHFNMTRAKGYYWNKEKNKWMSQIDFNDTRLYLGLFELEEDARQAYLDAKEKYHII